MTVTFNKNLKTCKGIFVKRDEKGKWEDDKGEMILDFFGISLRASRFLRVLPKLGGMAIYWGLEAVLKPPATLH